jgi:hypothetical protein
MAKDLERERAKFAYERVSAWKKLDLRPRPGDWLLGLPVMLRTQGLLATHAILRSKDGKGVAEALEAWLTREAPKPPLGGDREDKDFIVRCTSVDRAQYLAAQSEAVAFATTLKWVAQALGLPRGER